MGLVLDQYEHMTIVSNSTQELAQTGRIDQDQLFMQVKFHYTDSVQF